jgi:hypothetical protein
MRTRRAGIGLQRGSQLQLSLANLQQRLLHNAKPPPLPPLLPPLLLPPLLLPPLLLPPPLLLLKLEGFLNRECAVKRWGARGARCEGGGRSTMTGSCNGSMTALRRNAHAAEKR